MREDVAAARKPALITRSSGQALISFVLSLLLAAGLSCSVPAHCVVPKKESARPVLACKTSPKSLRPSYIPPSNVILHSKREFYIDVTGRNVFGQEWEVAEPFHDGYARVYADGDYTFIDATGRTRLRNERASYVGDFVDGLAQAHDLVSAATGYVDTTGKFVISPRYCACSDFDHNIASVIDKSEEGTDQRPFGGRPHFIDRSGNEIGQDIDYLGVFSDGLAPAKEKTTHKVGYVDRRLQFVLPPIWDDAEQFSEGLAQVAQGTKRFFINPAGEVLFEHPYYMASRFHNGLAKVSMPAQATLFRPARTQKEGLWWPRPIWCPYGIPRGLMNFHGRGLEPVGFIDRTGNLRVDFCTIERKLGKKFRLGGRFGGLTIFSEGLCAFISDHHCGFFDIDGRIVVPPKYDDVREFHDGLAPVLLNGKWGYIDRSGKVAIPLNFDLVYDFHEGLAAVNLHGKWGYISRSGKFVILPRFDSTANFQNGLAIVGLNKD